MKLSTLDLSIFAVYIVFVLALGMYAARKTLGTRRDYFLAGDRLSWWMVGGSIVASNLSSHQFVGMTGASYDRGFVAITAEWAAILIGLNALLWIFLPFYVKNGFYTMPEFLNRRFGGIARTTYGGLIILIYIFIEISAVLFLGALALHSLLGFPMIVSIILLAVLTAIYTIAGGLRAVVWTEMLQLGVLLLGGGVLSAVTIHAAGGWSKLLATSHEWHLLLPMHDPDYPWTQYLGGALCISTFYWATNQFIVQRALAAKNVRHARLGVVLSQYVKFLLPLLTVVPGLMAAKLFPHLERPDLAFPTLVQNLLPSGLIGLVLAGLIAAIMSHVSGAVNSCTTIASVDFYQPYIRPNATDAQVVRFGKWVGVAVVISGIFWAAMLIAHSQKPVFIYLMNAYGYFAPGIATMFLLGIFWKRATQAGALAAGALTVILSLALDWFYPDLAFANRTGIVFWACMMVGYLVSLVAGKRKSEEELKGLIWTFRGTFRGRSDENDDPTDRSGVLTNPTLWWIIINVAVVYFYIRFH